MSERTPRQEWEAAQMNVAAALMDALEHGMVTVHSDGWTMDHRLKAAIQHMREEEARYNAHADAQEALARQQLDAPTTETVQ